MTLKEFSKEHLSLDTAEGQKATWRRAFPIELREQEYVADPGGFFRGERTAFRLQERWVRIHKGDVIDTEWRGVERDYRYTDFRDI